MSKLSELLKDGAVSSAFSLLDTIVELVHGQLIAGGGFDDEFKQALATIVLWEPQLRAGAASTATKYDDKILDEILQAAEAILPPELIVSIRSIQVPYVGPVAEENASEEGPAEPSESSPADVPG